MARSTPNLVTQAEYARSRKTRGLPGGSRKAVHAAVRDNSVDAFGPDKLIDPELADRQWARNRRARIGTHGPVGVGGDGDDLVGQAAQAAGQSPVDAPAATPAPGIPDTGYSQARARRENAEAEQAEIDLKKSKGELVAWADVARGGFEVGRELRDTMESAVSALAAELAAEATAETCADILRRHNRAVCDVLVKTWREKIGPVPAGMTAA